MPRSLFDGLDEAYVSALLADPSCTVKTFAKGEVIFDPEHFTRHIGVILAGSARVMSRPHGGVTIRVLSKDMCFGVAAQYTDAETYVSCIVAQEPCRVLLLPQQVMQERIRTSPQLAENYIRFLTGRIRYLNALIDAYSSPTVEAKLARYLVAYTEGNAAPLETGMSELARILGVGRASLYRAMDSFARQGWIRREGKTVTILDLSSLKTI